MVSCESVPKTRNLGQDLMQNGGSKWPWWREWDNWWPDQSWWAQRLLAIDHFIHVDVLQTSMFGGSNHESCQTQDAKSKPASKTTSKTGVLHLEDGTPYIYGWPKERKAVKMISAPKQTVLEAAQRWPKQAMVCNKMRSRLVLHGTPKPPIRLMEKILYHSRCPKCIFHNNIKTFSVIVSGAGFFPSAIALQEIV